MEAVYRKTSILKTLASREIAGRTKYVRPVYQVVCSGVAKSKFNQRDLLKLHDKILPYEELNLEFLQILARAGGGDNPTAQYVFLLLYFDPFLSIDSDDHLIIPAYIYI